MPKVMTLEGLLFIDGQDAYTTYNVVVLKGGHKGLLQWPSLKEVESNDWHEYDGLEVDLAAPVLDSKEFAVDFYFFGEGSVGLGNLYSFVDDLRDGAYHTFNFAQVGKTVVIRPVSFGDPEPCVNGYAMTVTFADDFPMNGYEYLAPSSQVPQYDDYSLDGSPLTVYGVRVIEGTLKSAIGMPDIKKNLLRNISVLPGVIYDDPADDPNVTDTLSKIAYRDMELRCYLKAPTLSAFWRNYDALLYNLVKVDNTIENETMRGARTLNVTATGKAYRCYYKSQEVEDFVLDNNEVWAIFRITLAVTGMSGIAEKLLASEDWKYIITQDGKKIKVKYFETT